MKIIISTVLVLIMLLTGCAPQAQPTENPVSDAPSTPTEDRDSVEDVLVDRLSVNLGIDKSEITVKSEQEVEFSDQCLDIPSPEFDCAQVVTPGRVFILEANEIEYEYRTTTAGDTIQPATLALSWTREGGIAGFCDRLTVYLSGEVYGSNCRSDPNGTSGYFAELLSETEQEQFISWFQKYGKTSLDISDPAGVADRMVSTLVFYGSGTGKPGKAAQQALFDWATKLFQKLNS